MGVCAGKGWGLGRDEGRGVGGREGGTNCSPPGGATTHRPLVKGLCFKQRVQVALAGHIHNQQQRPSLAARHDLRNTGAPGDRRQVCRKRVSLYEGVGRCAENASAFMKGWEGEQAPVRAPSTSMHPAQGRRGQCSAGFAKWTPRWTLASLRQPSSRCQAILLLQAERKRPCRCSPVQAR